MKVKLLNEDEMSRRLKATIMLGDVTLENSLHNELLTKAGQTLEAMEIIGFIVTAMADVTGVEEGGFAAIFYRTLLDSFDAHVDAMTDDEKGAAEIKRIHADIMREAEMLASLDEEESTQH